MGNGEIPTISYTGNQFTLETDQKPLEAILSKSLNQATPRLQRILIRTFPYNFKIRYIPGPTNQIADCLSRLGVQKDSISLPKLQVNQMTSQLKARNDSLHRIRLATQADDNLAILKHIIQQGWPKTVKEVPQEIQKYWTFCEELMIEDGIDTKRYADHHTRQDERRYSETNTRRTLRVQQVSNESERNCILARF